MSCAANTQLEAAIATLAEQSIGINLESEQLSAWCQLLMTHGCPVVSVCCFQGQGAD